MDIDEHIPNLTGKLYAVLSQIDAELREANPRDAIADFLRAFPKVKRMDVEVEMPYGGKTEKSKGTDIMARGIPFEVKREVRDLGTDKDTGAGTQIVNRLKVCPAENCGWVTNGYKWVRYHRVDKKIKEEKEFYVERSEDNLFSEETKLKIKDLIKTIAGDLEKRYAPTDHAVIEAFMPIQIMIKDFSGKSKNCKPYQVKFSLWEEQLRGAHMRVPEGDAGHDLFSRHTLLIAASRLIAAELSRDASTDIVARITDGGGFSTWLNWEGGEQDFKERGNKICSAIYQAVIHYDWRKADEDILKHLYHDFIPSKDRHDFGEYYTPDWFAEMVTEKVLDEDYCKQALKAAFVDEDLAGLGVLDPACGSGAFLRAAARRLLFFAKDMGKSNLEISNAIAKLVYGFDIHPVAVELARATLLNALPEKPSQSLQIYLGDALQLHRESFAKNIGAIALFEQGGMLLQTSDKDGTVMFPQSILMRRDFEEIIDNIAGAEARDDQIENVLSGYQIEGEEEKKALREAVQIFQRVRDEGSDGIWAWFIKNLAQPHRLATSRVARIIGNPPWITYNDWKGDRQNNLKRLAEILNLWQGGKSAPQNDLAALFVVRVLKLYWSASKQVSAQRFGFVLPGSALKSEAWKNFRDVTWGGADLSKEPAWRVETNRRPFEQSACCVVFGESGGAKSLTKISRMHGEIEKPEFSDIKIYQNISSDFLPFVYNGATLFPHALVRVNKKNIRVASENTVAIKTCTGNKEPWKSLGGQEGELDKEDLRPALWSDSLLPFRILDLDFLVMPLELRLKEKNEKRSNLTSYWIGVDNLWRTHSTPNPPHKLLEQIDFNGKLSKQLAFLGNPLGNRVVYNKSGSNISAAVISEKNQVIIENALYRVATRTISESYYLATILNSDALSDALLESRNTDRHFDTLPFQKIPIKRFDKNNEHHLTLASLGKKAEQEAAAEAINEEQTTKSRADIRNALRASQTMQKIDAAVKAILPNYCD